MMAPRTGSFLRCWRAARMKQSHFGTRQLLRSMRLSDCMKSLRIAGLALAALLILPAGPSRVAAQSQSNAEVDDAIKVDVDVVSLYCTVHNKQNGLVGNLT